jgi:hypothetical protein
VIDPAVLAKLKELGIDPEQAQWVTTRSVKLADLPSIQRQREMLAKLRDILKAQLEKDLVQLDRAREEYQRSKNGGGT